MGELVAALQMAREVGEQREHPEPRGMAEDTEDHRGAPAEAFQDITEDRHCADLGDLADAHHRHDPLRRDADLFDEEVAGQHEVAHVHRRIDESCDDDFL